jgi:hypothetical protein
VVENREKRFGGRQLADFSAVDSSPVNPATILPVISRSYGLYFRSQIYYFDGYLDEKVVKSAAYYEGDGIHAEEPVNPLL